MTGRPFNPAILGEVIVGITIGEPIVYGMPLAAKDILWFTATLVVLI